MSIQLVHHFKGKKINLEEKRNTTAKLKIERDITIDKI